MALTIFAVLAMSVPAVPASASHGCQADPFTPVECAKGRVQHLLEQLLPQQL
jgi:hypothetical protein